MPAETTGPTGSSQKDCPTPLTRPNCTDAAGQQSSAFFTGSPFKSDVSTQLNGSPRDADGNPKVTSSLGTSSQVFGVGLLGSHTNVGTLAIPKLYSSTIDLSVRLPQITSPANLKVGLLDPVGIGSGFESLHFQVFKEGTPVIDQFFTGTTRLDDALAYFDDHTLDLGRIDQGVSGLLDVQFRFGLILTSPGTGFDTTFLLANGPTTPTLTRAFAPLSLFASVSVLRSSSVSVVPEPASAGVIVLLGSVALLERRRRRPSV